jgi:hypothetical protein
MALSKSAIFYRKNKRSRDKKKAYDSDYHSTEERKDYRVELNRERRRRHLKGNAKDLSHKSDGSLVLESRKRNRARNGHGDNGRLKA